MKRDHDYVTMDDYKADMDETATQAANIIAGLREKLDRQSKEALHMLAAVVIASGGKVDVSISDLASDHEVTIQENPMIGGYTITAKRR